MCDVAVIRPLRTAFGFVRTAGVPGSDILGVDPRFQRVSLAFKDHTGATFVGKANAYSALLYRSPSCREAASSASPFVDAVVRRRAGREIARAHIGDVLRGGYEGASDGYMSSHTVFTR